MLLGEIMNNLKLIFVLAFLLITGCSSQMAITYDSYPKGAQVIDSTGTVRGYAPVTFYIDPTKEDKERGYAYTWDIWMKWVSGATEKVNAGRVGVGQNWVYTINRPSNAPNAQADHSFALQLQQSRQMNQVLQNTQAIQDEQNRVKQQKQNEDNTQYLCNLGLLNHPGCK